MKREFLMVSLLDCLRVPSLAAVDIDGKGRLGVHASILARKVMLRQVFAEFHQIFDDIDKTYFAAQGLRIEIGAGVAPMRESFSDVLATDVVPSDDLDLTLDAEAMALADGSVRTIFGQNCFHHFSHPERFFAELTRVLAPGGGAVLLEPYHGPVASFLYPRLFSTEGFDKEFASWETPVSGPMNGANQALSYIVFKRDLSVFQSKFPTLKLVYSRPCGNYIRYLLSGGLNFRQLAPNWAAPFIAGIERLLRPLAGGLALHHILVLRHEP